MDEKETNVECPDCGSGFTVHHYADDFPLPHDVLLSLYRQKKINAGQLDNFTLADLYMLILSEEVRAA